MVPKTQRKTTHIEEVDPLKPENKIKIKKKIPPLEENRDTWTHRSKAKERNPKNPKLKPISLFLSLKPNFLSQKS